MDDKKPMAQAVVFDIAQLKGLVGKEVAVSDWLIVSQSRIDTFAAASGDDQWIQAK